VCGPARPDRAPILGGGRVLRRSLGCAALAGTLACAGPLLPSRAGQPEPDLRPGMVVQVPAPAPACVSKQKLAELGAAGARRDEKVMGELLRRG